MENNDSIKLYLNTLTNINGTIKLAIKKHDTEFIIKILKKLKEATGQLGVLLSMEKERRFTA
tara:strand:- start:1284 stop:1469 length:186 start_codon:yes stop_codon:yes gene_type:complete